MGIHIFRAGATLLAALAAASAAAQDFPSKPVTIVVPYAAGGATDMTARRLAEALTKSLRTPVIVDNKAGAATTIAAAFVARSAADGYTLLMAPGTTTSMNPYLFKRLPYKTDDFAPVSLVSKQAFALSVHPGTPSKSVAEFVNWGKSRQGGMTFGTTGTGSFSHILGEWIGKTAGITMKEVPYKGTAPATLDMLVGRIDMVPEGITTAIPMHQSGKSRVVAITGETRSPQLPDVPTLRESGYPDLVAYTYFGLLAPSGTPAAVISKLHAAVVAAVNSPEFAQKVAASGETPQASATPRQYAELLREEHARWGKVIAPMNITLD